MILYLLPLAAVIATFIYVYEQLDKRLKELERKMAQLESDSRGS